MGSWAQALRCCGSSPSSSSHPGQKPAAMDKRRRTFTSTSTRSSRRAKLNGCQLASVRGGINNSSFFGLMAAVDDMLRQGADPSSCLIGRMQGLAVGASLSDGAFTTVVNFVFTDGPYNGSTLHVFGRSIMTTAVMERPILGGTGAFRMARGYMLRKMVESPDPSNLLILKFDAYVWH